MKCPICNVQTKRGEKGTIPVVLPVNGLLQATQAHSKCLEEARKSRTTVQRT